MIIRRSRLLNILEDRTKHILLCAPSGYGKTVLLKEFQAQHPECAYITAQSDWNVPQLLQKADAASGNPFVVLIDDAHLLHPTVISQLLNLPLGERRFVLSVRHIRYPKVQLLLQRACLAVVNASDLALTESEIAVLNPDANAAELHRQTGGWPHAVQLASGTPDHLELYLQDLLSELPDRLYTLLLESASAENIERALDSHPLNQHLLELSNLGFPLETLDKRLRIHPLMSEHLLSLGDQSTVVTRPPNEELSALLPRLEKLSVFKRMEAIERFFAQQGEDEFDIDAKLQLLSAVPPEVLSPLLRDVYANYLYAVGQTEEAKRISQLQRDLGTASTRTHITFARLSNSANDFLAYKAHLDLALQEAVVDADHARYHNMMAMYFVRLNRFAEAIKHAQEGYGHALRSNDVNLHMTALIKIGYVQQLSGDLIGAIAATKEALQIAEGRGARFYRRTTEILSNLADMLKDAGEHEQALTMIQRGLHLLATPDQGSAPFLYTTRGLVYMEFGEFESAIQSFDTSIAGFESAGYLPGLLLPHTYAAYAAYRLGQHARLERAAMELAHVVDRCSARMGEYREFLYYQPLVSGLVHLSHGNQEAALKSLRSIQTEGGMTYDSVLLATLTVGKILVGQNALDEAYAQTLNELLQQRNTPGDATAIMYREYYEDVFRASMKYVPSPQRFQRILAAPRVRFLQQTQTLIQMVTLGQLELWVQGRTITTKSKYPLHALAFLALKGGWVTPRELGDQVFRGDDTDPTPSRRRASTAINQLRMLFRELDVELEQKIIETNPEHGYRLTNDSQIAVQLDISPYLSDSYHPNASDQSQLSNLLSVVLPFQVGGSGPFNDSMNRDLFMRTEAVATHLSNAAITKREYAKAALHLLYGLRLTRSEELEATLGSLLIYLEVESKRQVQSVLTALSLDNDDMSDLFVMAIKACEQNKV
jgi:tetratricopeptide (TPR) repeat protein